MLLHRSATASAGIGVAALLALHGHQKALICEPKQVGAVGSALELLREEGFCVLAPPMRVSADEAHELIRIVAEGRELSRCAAQQAGGRPQRGGFLEVLHGRFHANLLNESRCGEGGAARALDEWHTRARTAMDAVSARFVPLADAFFEGRGEDCDGRSYYLSQLQLLDVEPGCDAQFLHRDNVAPGLTLIVPLVPVLSGARGPTELLPRSHAAVSGALQAARRHGGAAQALCAAGDVVAFDSRVLHRGGAVARVGNDQPVAGDPTDEALWAAAQAHRPALVFRWDAPCTPPPGVGVAGTMIQRCLGLMLAGIGSVCEWLP